MRIIVISILFSFFSLHSHAQTIDFSCVAESFEVTSSQLKNHVRKPLRLVSQTGSYVNYSVDIGERSFILSGDLASGDFLLTQSWGEGYTNGINATGSFSSVGRLQISQVQGSLVFKLLCLKKASTEFPKE